MKKKLIVIVVSIVVILLGGLALWFFYFNKESDSERFNDEYSSVTRDNVFVYKNIDEIIIAIASINDESLRGIIDKCKDAKVSVKIMPGVAEMIDKKFSINKIRDVNVEDLLGREAITLDHEGISDYLEGKVVLVTGGGGSIGSELCRQIAKFEPKQLIIFDIYENNAYEIQNELKRNYPNLNLVT